MKVTLSVENGLPVGCEYLGDALNKQAEATAQIPHLKSTAAHLYRLAANAYQHASGVTLGHKRGEAYEVCARLCTEKAQQLEAK